MKKNIGIVLITLLLLPSVVYAGSSNEFPLTTAIFMEAFITIHMTIFVLKPASYVFGKDDPNKWFKRAFILRIGILLFFDIFITPMICIFDFLAVFVGAFLVMPLCIKKGITSLKNLNAVDTVKCPKCNADCNKGDKFCTSCGETLPIDTSSMGIKLQCAKCGMEVNVVGKFCTNCGVELVGDNIVVLEEQKKKTLLPSDFDHIYFMSEDACVEEFIKRELDKCGVDKNTSLIPSDILKKKKIMNLIFLALVFVYISLIFFHFPILTYVIGAIILFVFYKVKNQYDLIKYLKKQIISRPSEKISNIIYTAKETMIEDNTNKQMVGILCLVVVSCLVIFMKPHVLYEKMDNGYGVRFYTFGLTNFTKAEIPEKYKGEPVVSLRGNTFSNMPFLNKVVLPDTIIEIRGQAFKNDYLLKDVNIPKELEYLGGGAFYNCKSIKNIELPDTLTYMGGEVFYKATNLESIKLSNNLEEIRGNSFEECSSLKEITIPDKVMRIGGHAFYGNTSLEKVEISENSKLAEIGSSAFRVCTKLNTIYIPKTTIVNDRAFKESPTRVLRYGQVNYGSLVDKNNYSYSRYITLYLKDNVYISDTSYNSIIYKNNGTITLDSIEQVDGLKYFKFTYADSTMTKKFELSKAQPSFKINDDIEIEIYKEYVFDYTNRVTLNVYFN